MLELNPIDPRLATAKPVRVGPPIGVDQKKEPIGSFQLFLIAILVAGILIGSKVGGAFPGRAEVDASMAPMTYNGMTLMDFAAEMDMPADNPYLIAMFEELCESDSETVSQIGI